MKAAQNRYTRIIEKIFFKYYQEGATEIPFEREDINRVAKELKIRLPKNLGDILYSFRYRSILPDSVREKAPLGQQWIIRSRGRSSYAFIATHLTIITPSEMLGEIKIPDATPGVITMYALSDEQALLAKIRYNRLLDIFTGVTCYSLQSHLRTTVPNMGQVETDEMYVGIDEHGAQYVFPVQAKGRKDKLGIVQIEQDFAVCADKFPELVCRPIAAQFMSNDVIALFKFGMSENGIVVSSDKHYRLVPAEEMTPEDLEKYRQQP
jgi:hypothetical protein